MNKKHLILILFLTIISIPVKAEELKYPDVTENIEIRYKWYKEIISPNGTYYPLRKIKEGDTYDKDVYKFVKSVHINEETCSYPNEFYMIEKINYIRYKKVHDAKYVVIENVEQDVELKIYYESRPIEYKIISGENNKLVIELKDKKMCDKLLFYVNTDNKYKISLYVDSSLEQLIIAKEFENQKVSNPNYTWLLETTQFYYTDYTEKIYNTNNLIDIKDRKIMCASYEKYVYKYDVTREYYDDEYHAYVEGYIKDETDYKFYYKGEPIVITNTIEITKEKIKEIPKIEYVYIEKESLNEEPKTCEKEEQKKEIYKTIQTQIIEREKNTIPKKVYLIISILILIIVITIIEKIIKKWHKN